MLVATRCCLKYRLRRDLGRVIPHAALRINSCAVRGIGEFLPLPGCGRSQIHVKHRVRTECQLRLCDQENRHEELLARQRRMSEALTMGSMAPATRTGQRPKPERGGRRLMSHRHVMLLTRTLEAGPLTKRVTELRTIALILLLWHTGFRLGLTLRLKRRDIGPLPSQRRTDHSPQALYDRVRGASARRWIALPDVAARAVTAYIEAAEESDWFARGRRRMTGALFVGERSQGGRPGHGQLSLRAAEEHWHALRRRARIHSKYTLNHVHRSSVRELVQRIAADARKMANPAGLADKPAARNRWIRQSVRRVLCDWLGMAPRTARLYLPRARPRQFSVR